MPVSAVQQISPEVSPCLVGTMFDAANPLELNNVAVSFSQSRRNEEALALLQEALDGQNSSYGTKATHQLERAEPCAPSTALACSSPPFPSLSQSLRSLLGLSTSTTDAPLTIDPKRTNIYGVSFHGRLSSTQASDDLSASPSNCFSLYNQLFAFKELKVESLGFAHRTFLPPAVMLYNMGVTYHRRALKNGHSENYARALSLYGLSIQIIEESIIYGLCVPDYSLLQLALYNNIGFIHSHFFNDDLAIVCAGRLLGTFVSMDCSRLLSKDEYVFYYMNLLFFLNRTPKIAPAA